MHGTTHIKINTVIFNNILPCLIKMKVLIDVYAAFTMDRILENFVMHFMWLLLYLWYLYCRTPRRWLQERPKHVDAKNKKHMYLLLYEWLIKC
jgi:hypothetical protein